MNIFDTISSIFGTPDMTEANKLKKKKKVVLVGQVLGYKKIQGVLIKERNVLRNRLKFDKIILHHCIAVIILCLCMILLLAICLDYIRITGDYSFLM